MWVFASEVTGDRHDFRHAGHPADQYQVIHLRGVQPGILKAVFAGRDGALNSVLAELLELGFCELHGEMLGPACIGRYKRQVDVGGHRG